MKRIFSKDIQTAGSNGRSPCCKGGSSRVSTRPPSQVICFTRLLILASIPMCPPLSWQRLPRGKYRDARLLGGFQRHDERMILVFNRAVLASGQSFQLEAYAVDPQTSEASVASSVDTHFFSRWGGLIASAFLEGLGSAKDIAARQALSMAMATMQVTRWSGIITALKTRHGLQPERWAKKASKIFEKNFDRPPTVHLESGTTVGILILNVKGK